MKKLILEVGTTHIQYGEIAHLLAEALWPESEDKERYAYGGARVNFDGELRGAVQSGVLPVKDPLTFGPHSFPIGRALLSALVTVDDLKAFVAERGIDVVTGPAQTTAFNPPAPAPNVGHQAWQVFKPQRYTGYAAPLHRLLSEAHRANTARPSARDVLETWRTNRPAEIAKVLTDSVDYYDSKGNTKTANLEALRKAITRMTTAR